MGRDEEAMVLFTKEKSGAQREQSQTALAPTDSVILKLSRSIIFEAVSVSCYSTGTAAIPIKQELAAHSKIMLKENHSITEPTASAKPRPRL